MIYDPALILTHPGHKNAHRVVILEEGLQVSKKPGNCPNCGADWDGVYCEYHMKPRKPIKVGVTVQEARKALESLGSLF